MKFIYSYRIQKENFEEVQPIALEQNKEEINENQSNISSKVNKENEEEIPQNKTLSKKCITSSKNNSLNQSNILHTLQNDSFPS